MSRIGKIPIEIPKGAKVSLNNGTAQVEGPKGKLSLTIPAGVNVEQKDNNLIVTRVSDVKQYRSSHGTVRVLLVNMLTGVTEGHKKELEIQGIGFRAQVQGEKLTMALGLSHPVEFQIPKEVKVSAPKPTSIVVEGTDRAIVGNVAAKIRGFKPPEPYKGKGIRYVGEVIKRKQGKSVTK